MQDCTTILGIIDIRQRGLSYNDSFIAVLHTAYSLTTSPYVSFPHLFFTLFPQTYPASLD